MVVQDRDIQGGKPFRCRQSAFFVSANSYGTEPSLTVECQGLFYRLLVRSLPREPLENEVRCHLNNWESMKRGKLSSRSVSPYNAANTRITNPLQVARQVSEYRPSSLYRTMQSYYGQNCRCICRPNIPSLTLLSWT